MIIEVTGTNVRNKGAELMLVAICQQLRAWDPSIQIAVDFSFGNQANRAKYGLLLKAEIQKIGRSKLALNFMPDSFRDAVGIVRDNDIDAVVDASGFAFGDQHPVKRSERFADFAEKTSKQGKPVVLLPQALGPFTTPRSKQAFARIANASNIIYTRESASFEHVAAIVDEVEKIRVAPDFTNLVKPTLTINGADSRRVCIVPNDRMLEKAVDDAAREAYISWLIFCIEICTESGLDPVVLVHGDDDNFVVEKLFEQMSSAVPVMRISDPVELKRYIGESHLMVGSRFHALASALSQGVPALATSWSHKYEMLFEDYGVSEFVTQAEIKKESLIQIFNQLIGEKRQEVVKKLLSRGLELEQQTRSMWQEVQQVIC